MSVLTSGVDRETLCWCGHHYSDHDGDGEECAECEELPPPRNCREFRQRGSTWHDGRTTRLPHEEP